MDIATITFAYTVLVLALASIVGVLSFKYLNLQAGIRSQARRRASQKRIEKQTADIEAVQSRVAQLEQAPSKDFQKVPAPINLFKKMEDRHAGNLKEIVSVNGQEQRIRTA